MLILYHVRNILEFLLIALDKIIHDVHHDHIIIMFNTFIWLCIQT